MDIMLATHGTADIATLNEWKSLLKAPLESGKGFSHLATLHRHYNARLENNGQPESELTKCTRIAAAVSTYPEYTKAGNDYNTTTPLVAQRTFDDYCAYVNLHVPNITVGGAGYANGAMVAGRGAGRGRANRGIGHSGQGQGRLAVKGLLRNYCYMHGYDGHKGPGPSGCRGMSAANSATPGTYTNAMINAADHLSGGSQHNF